MQYGGFWRRVAAYFIDILIMSPIIWCLYKGLPMTRWFLVLWLIPGTALGLAYNVWLVRRFGGTPGLLLMKLRIRMLDGRPVTLGAATVRYSVLFCLAILLAIAGAVGSLRIDELTYRTMSFIQLAGQLALHKPGWSVPLDTMANLWIFSEFLVLLFNDKRRAIQDFMAGTVVVKVGSITLAGPAKLQTSGPA